MTDTVYLIIGNNINLKEFSFKEGSFLVGVDRGALEAVKAGIILDLSYGDFDSVNKKELNLIEEHSKKMHFLNPIKDDSDTEGALNLISSSKHIILLGSIQGKRIEHFLSILGLFREHDNIELLDDNSSIIKLRESASPYHMKKDEYKFYSFFPFNKSVITLKGFKYPMENRTLALSTSPSLYLSNELKDETGEIFIKGDPLLLVRTIDDKRGR